jgi:hypothetical protein
MRLAHDGAAAVTAGACMMMLFHGVAAINSLYRPAKLHIYHDRIVDFTEGETSVIS